MTATFTLTVILLLGFVDAFNGILRMRSIINQRILGASLHEGAAWAIFAASSWLAFNLHSMWALAAYVIGPSIGAAAATYWSRKHAV